jgi:hypothetical protein
MATAYTKGDTLGIYKTESAVGTLIYNLGGRKSNIEITPQFFVGETSTIPPIVITAMSGNNTGAATLSAKSADTLAFTGTSGTEGDTVTVAARASVLVEDTSDNLWCRVYRDTDYSSSDLGGFYALQCFPELHGSIGLPLVNTQGSIQNNYHAFMLSNHSALGETVTSIRACIGTLGTQRVTATAQLGGAGSGTITTATANGFADWPDKGWAHIKTNAPATREIVYYSSRTATSLTVPADGRGRLGTSAAAGAATDTIDAVPGIRIGYEAMDSNGEIQTIASITTAPTGITWDTDCTLALGLAIGTLNPRQNVGIWIHREIPANVSEIISSENKINIDYVVDGVTYTNTIRGYYRIQSTGSVLYSLWLGEGANPDLTVAPDTTSSSLPISLVITPPGAGTQEYRATVRQTNAYGITGHETNYFSIWVNSAGTQVTKPINSPTDITVRNLAGGVAQVICKYQPLMDSTPATRFAIYSTTNGFDPDPAIDVPTYVNFSDSTQVIYSQFDGAPTLYYKTSTLAYGTDYRVIVRAATGSAESENSTVSQLTITTVLPTYTPQANSMHGTSFGNIAFGSQKIETDTFASTWKYDSYMHEAILYTGTTVVMRSCAKEYDKGRIFIPASFSFDNVAHSAAASSTTYLIEAIDANTAYILVGSTRRAKIDLVAGTIEAAEFDWGIGITDDIPTLDYAYGNSSATYLLQYSPIRGRYVPWLKLTSGGVLSTQFPVTQRRS